MTLEYLFQPLFPESQILQENMHKSHWATDWLELFAIFQ